jgi:hypothetical protein
MSDYFKKNLRFELTLYIWMKGLVGHDIVVGSERTEGDRKRIIFSRIRSDSYSEIIPKIIPC